MDVLRKNGNSKRLSNANINLTIYCIICQLYK